MGRPTPVLAHQLASAYQNFQIGKVSVHPRHCFAIHRADGYEYSFGETFVADGVHAAPRQCLKAGVSAAGEIDDRTCAAPRSWPAISRTDSCVLELRRVGPLTASSGLSGRSVEQTWRSFFLNECMHIYVSGFS